MLQKIRSLNWSERKIRFALNIFWGTVIAVALNGIAYFTLTGHIFMNAMYDDLVVGDFRRAAETNEFPVSDRIRLVTFGRETYDEHPGAAHTQRLWTPRKLLGETILKSLKLGARVVVADFAVNTPAPVFCNPSGETENDELLSDLKEAVEYAEESDAVIILARGKDRSHKDDREKEYARKFNDLIEKHKKVIKLGSPGSLEDVRDYQVRHLRFYERTRQNEIYFSVQILAVTYLLLDRDQGNDIIKDTKKKILKGESEITMDMGEMKIRLSDQSDLSREYLSARYVFRLAHAELMEEHGLGTNPYSTYPDLKSAPHELGEQGTPYSGKAVLIGSEYKDIGDLHLTPIGRTHGIFLIANGINLFLKGLQIHEPGIHIKVLVELICVIISALLFVRFHATIAFLILIGIFYIVSQFVSPALFSKFGLLTDVCFPVVGVGVSRLIADTDKFFVRHILKRKGTSK